MEGKRKRGMKAWMCQLGDRRLTRHSTELGQEKSRSLEGTIFDLAGQRKGRGMGAREPRLTFGTQVCPISRLRRRCRGWSRVRRHKWFWREGRTVLGPSGLPWLYRNNNKLVTIDALASSELVSDHIGAVDGGTAAGPSPFPPPGACRPVKMTGWFSQLLSWTTSIHLHSEVFRRSCVDSDP